MRCSSCNAPMEIVVTPEQRKYVCTVCGKEVPCPNEQLEVNYEDELHREEYFNRVRDIGRRYEAIRRREEKRYKIIIVIIFTVLIVSFVSVLYSSVGEGAELVEESEGNIETMAEVLAQFIPIIVIAGFLMVLINMLRWN